MKRHLSSMRRTVAFACAVCLGPIVQTAHGAQTDIADLPPILTTQAKPNIMFMLDNSGSMQNIVPDLPYDKNTTYLPLTSCPVPNRVGNGVAAPALPTTLAAELRIISGIPKVRIGSTNYDYGTANGRRCFNPTLNYLAKLNADDTSCGTNTACPTGYLGAVYTGNYLNWYFSNSLAATPDYTTSASFAPESSIKPGTKSRITIAKSSAIAIVNSLDRVRTGLFTYNNGNGGRLLRVMDDIDVNRGNMISSINGLTASGNTPLGETLADIGKYFATGYTGALKLHPGRPNEVSRTVAQVFPHSYSNGSGVTTPPEPIQNWCQKSFAVLLTDGRPQGDQNENTNIGTDLLDYDGDCSGTYASNCNAFSPTHDRKNNRQYESEGSDYLDDIAQALFEIDLRPDYLAPSANQKKKNNILTYPIGFADAQVQDDPLLQSTANQGQLTPEEIAAGKLGLRVNAGNEAELLAAFEKVTQDILEKDGAASAVAVANAYVSAGDNSVFATRYNSGNWTGDLIAYPLDVSTGVVNLQDPVWDDPNKCANPNAYIDTSSPIDTTLGKRGCSAQVRLNERNLSSSPRFIASYSCSGSPVACGGVEFQPSSASTSTKLSSTETALLNTPPSGSDAAAVINYLRGARSGETAGTYRSRTALLGDIVNAEPVIVREPSFAYTDVGYKEFKTAQANRHKVVYQGANDGMLHAFDAADATELWAYVPRFLLGSLNELTRKGYTHRFYVDGNATAGDVDFLRTDGATATETSSQWHTILVGGLGKGGRGYYALDITNPVPTSEAAAAAKVLWEFPNEANKNTVLDATSGLTIDKAMGYSFGRPLIVKTTKGWVVVVTSGYNNGTTTGGNGKGYLFVLNAKTGGLIKAIRASIGGSDAVEGNADTPSGLAQISPFLENPGLSGRVNHIYGGDNLGNVWRFNLSDPNTSEWSVTKVARLVDDNGNAQSITSRPELARLVLGAREKRMVFVGTGRYFGTSDVSNTQVQTMYGLLENLAITGDNTVIDPLRSNLVEQVLSLDAGAGTRSFPANANEVNLNTKKGWYVDMPASGERINTNPTLVRGIVVFTSNVPSADTCTFGGTSWFNVFNSRTGARVAGVANTTPSSYSLGNALASRPVIVKTQGGFRSLTQKTNIQIDPRDVPVAGIGAASRRVSWKEVVDKK